MNLAIDLIAAVVGAAFLVLVVTLIALTVRKRPPQSPRTRGRRPSMSPRSMAGWQRAAIGEIRDVGRRQR